MYSILVNTISLCDRSGRPRFNISKQQLEYLCSLSFKWNGIAILLGVSRINLSKMHYGFLNAAHLMFSNNSEHTDIEYCNFSIIYLVKCKINCLHHTVFPLPQLTDWFHRRKMDIMQAYRQIPVHPQDRRLLGMAWDGKVYVDTTLPFSLRSAPLLFTAVADAAQWVMTKHGAAHVFH